MRLYINFRFYVTGERNLKTQGSHKVDGMCSAKINVMVLNDSIVEIQYMKTHAGHTNDLGHLNLSKAGREMIAMKIAVNVPFQTILDDVIDSIWDEKLERTHL